MSYGYITSGLCTNSSYIHATVCKADKRDDLSGVSELFPCSTYVDTLAEPHYAPPPNELHRLAPSPSCPVAAYKSSASQH